MMRFFITFILDVISFPHISVKSIFVHPMSIVNNLSGKKRALHYNFALASKR